MKKNSNIFCDKVDKDPDQYKLQNALTEVLISTDPLASTIFSKILSTYLEFTPWEAGALWLSNGNDADLHCHAYNYPSDWAALQGYLADKSQKILTKGLDLPSKIWETGKPYTFGTSASIKDINEEELAFQDEYELAIQGGTKSIWIYPLNTGKCFLGVFEFFSRQNIPPNEKITSNWANSIFQTAQFLERIKLEKLLIQKQCVLPPTYESLADATPMLIRSIDSDGICNFWNRTWLNFRGKTSQVNSCIEWTAGIHPEDVPKCMEIFSSSFPAHIPFQMEYRLLRFDGNYHCFMETLIPCYNENNVFSGYVGGGVDCTEFMAIEEQLRQSQKMGTIGRLASGIAHDFNNLLTAINGFGKLALNIAPDIKSLREYLQEVINAAETATSLTHQLLQYIRKEEIAPLEVNPNLTILEINPLLKSLVPKDIDLKLNLEPNLGMIKTDLVQLKQIILNLVLNARDAMPKGGILAIETKNTVLDENHPNLTLKTMTGPHVQIEVRDTGDGMNNDTLSHIFEPFFTTKKPEQGTGLGLMSVYGIVKENSGSIEVKSEVGKGTTFKVFFPLITSKKPDFSTGSTGKHETHTDLFGIGTILVVEDDPKVSKFVFQSLTDFGYTVFDAKDAEEALLALKIKTSIDLVITDLVMPGISGQQLATQVLQKRPEMNFLFMSGILEAEINLPDVPNHEITFLKKPFDQIELLKSVKYILANKQKIEEKA
jgi:nitrogen-specific signal transduction histidine kinase/ActR/RegA family two-component response regulator/PAS domain-containing protein